MDCNTAEKNIQSYVERKLDREQLEDFLEHIENCESCSKELEVSFSIYYALKQLMNEEDDSFDIQELLKEDMIRAKEYIQKEEDRIFIKRLYNIVFAIGILLFLGIFIESIYYGGFQRTPVYKIMHTEMVVHEMATEAEEVTVEAVQPQTNHKNIVIVSVPETEEPKQPGFIPDDI